MRRPIGYAILFAWTAIVCSIQLVALGLIPYPLTGDGASGGDVVPTVMARMLVPDLSTILLVAVAGRLAKRDLVAIALTVAASRIAFTGAQPFAVLAGTLAVAFIADGLRRFAELDRPGLRVLSTGLGSFLYASWLMFVDVVRSNEAGARGSFGTDASGGGAIAIDAVLWPFMTAAATAVIAFALWPAFRNLPGLGRLERRAF